MEGGIEPDGYPMILSEIYRGKNECHRTQMRPPELLLVHRKTFGDIEREIYESNRNFAAQGDVQTDINGFRSMQLEGMQVIVDPLIPEYQVWYTWNSEYTPADQPHDMPGKYEERMVPEQQESFAGLFHGEGPSAKEAIGRSVMIQRGQRLIETVAARCHKHDLRGAEKRRAKETADQRERERIAKKEARERAKLKKKIMKEKSEKLGDSQARIEAALRKNKGIDYLLENLD